MLTLKDIYQFDLNSKKFLNSINDFISELIPIFSSCPYEIKKEDTIEDLYEKFRNREIGGWCGLFTSYMLMILNKCGIDAYAYNYGLCNTEFTHMVVIANGYLLDPYFNKVYIDKAGELITFKTLLQMIADRDFSFSCSYGQSIKTKRIDKGEKYEFITLSGYEWEKSLMQSWIIKSFDDIMMEKFGDVNPYLLLLHNLKGI